MILKYKIFIISKDLLLKIVFVNFLEKAVEVIVHFKKNNIYNRTYIYNPLIVSEKQNLEKHSVRTSLLF